MGCDIHAYLEFRDPKALNVNGEINTAWRGWGAVHLPRNYAIFGRLAGVRTNATPVVEPRGVPEDMCFWTSGEYWKPVSDDYAENAESAFVSTARAKEWAEFGSVLRRDDKGTIIGVSHPDYHTHSWVTPDEFAKVLGEFKPDYWSISYWAMLGAMRELEWHGMEVRLVFWFDN